MTFRVGVQDRVMLTITSLFPYKSDVTIMPSIIGEKDLDALHIVFVDEMTARQLRERYPHLPIVVVAEKDRDPFALFQLHVFDAIYPPVEKEKVWRILTDALAFYSVKPFLSVPVSKTRMEIPLSEILYVIADCHSVRIKTITCDFRASTTFRDVMDQLETDRRFLIVNRGVVVNMSYIEIEEDDKLRMQDGQVIPIRTKGRSEIHRQIAQYTFSRQLW